MLKATIVVLTLSGALAVGAQAAPARGVPQQTCIGEGIVRTAARDVAPGDCCSGRMRCSQFLSTMIVVRPGRLRRT